ncbi:MAG: conjugal transfer protein TraF [Fimbriimonadaceae bacterium]
MIPLLLLTASVDRTADVTARLANFLKSVKTMSVEFTIRPPGGGKAGSGRLVVERPNKTRFDLKLSGIDYSFSATPSGTIEVLRSGKKYDENRPAQSLGFPPPGITRVNEYAFPLLLVSQHPREAVSSEAVFSWKGEAVIGGKKTDHLVASWNGRGGVGEAHFYVDSAGKPLKVDWQSNAGNELSGAATDFRNFRVNKPIPPADFALVIPPGYVPHRLQYPIPSLAQGERLNLGRWMASNGAIVNLADRIKGKTLLFFSAEGCGPSNQLRSELKQIAAEFQVPVLELNVDGKAARSGFPTFSTNDPGVFERLGVDGTPTIIAINGKVAGRTWYGYAPAQKALLRTTLKEMLDELK